MSHCFQTEALEPRALWVHQFALSPTGIPSETLAQAKRLPGHMPPPLEADQVQFLVDNLRKGSVDRRKAFGDVCVPWMTHPRIIDEIIRWFEDKNYEIRTRAVNLLQQTAGDAAVSAKLLKALNDPSSSTRLCALRALSIHLTKNPAIIPAVITCADDRDMHVQAEALKVLAPLLTDQSANTNYRQQVETLCRDRLTSSDAQVLAAAIGALTPLAAEDHSLRQTLRTFVTMQTDEAVYLAAAKALGPAAVQDPETLNHFKSLMNGDKKGLRRQLQILSALKLYVDQPEIRAFFLYVLDIENLDSSLCAYSLIALESQAEQSDVQQMLRKFIDYPDANAQAAVLKSLSPTIEKDAQMLQIVRKGLTDKRPSVRWAAWTALYPVASRLQDFDELETRFREETSEKEDLRKDALQTLGSAATMETLFRWLDDPLPDFRAEAVTRLAAIHASVPLRQRILTAILPRLRDDHWRVVAAAIRALTPLADEDANVRAALRSCLSNPEPHVQTYATQALASTASDEQLLEWVSHPGDRVRHVAIQCITKRPFTPAIRNALVARLSSETNENTRAEAVLALIPYATDPIVRKAFLDGLAGGDEFLRWGATRALAPQAINDPEIRDALHDRMNDPWYLAQNSASLAIRSLLYGREPLASQWHDSARFKLASSRYFEWLTVLLTAAHHAFLRWVSSESLARIRIRLPGIRSEPPAQNPLLSEEVTLDSENASWHGRSLLVPDAHGLPGGTFYKFMRAQESLEDFLTEASLWNTLHPEELIRAEVIEVRLHGAPTKDIPIHWKPGEPMICLRYHVSDRAAFMTYPLDWQPESLEELTQWITNIAGQLGLLAEAGWGYVGLVDYYHDMHTSRTYDLEARPPGSLENFPWVFRYANVRALGNLADVNPAHMIFFNPEGAQGPQLVRVIRDQTFQLALVAATVAQRRGWVTHDTSDRLVPLLRSLGHAMASAYHMPETEWESLLSIALSDTAENLLFAMENLQTESPVSAPSRLGTPNGPFGAPSLVAFAETLASVIVDGLARKQVDAQELSKRERAA